MWNGLPSEVTSASSLSVFKNRLKTYLFRRCYETVSLAITFPFPSVGWGVKFYSNSNPFLVIISYPRKVVLAILFTV